MEQHALEAPQPYLAQGDDPRAEQAVLLPGVDVALQLARALALRAMHAIQVKMGV